MTRRNTYEVDGYLEITIVVAIQHFKPSANFSTGLISPLSDEPISLWDIAEPKLINRGQRESYIWSFFFFLFQGGYIL